MSLVGRIKSYAALGLDWLLGRFDDAGNIQRIIKAAADEIQELEDALHEQLEARLLDEATGDQLDLYGELVDQARNGRSDDEYRELIKVKILRNSSDATPERLIEIYKRLLVAQYVEYDDADAVVEMIAWDNSPVSGILEQVHALVQSSAPAGVRVRLIQADSTNSFRYDTSGQGYDQGEYSTRV